VYVMLDIYICLYVRRYVITGVLRQTEQLTLEKKEEKNKPAKPLCVRSKYWLQILYAAISPTIWRIYT